jgi:NADPH-dependent 2,4-dienoyl-CoA reductase/sulfur reductase-like enzyme
MSEQHFIIIGNGPAGNQAALTLSETVSDSRVTLISKHAGGCYRPHLLPHFVAGELHEEELYVFSPSSYKDMGIKLRSGQEVVGIDLDRRQVILDHREVLPFDGIIIAVGGKPRIPENMTVFTELMLTLKDLEDAKFWMKRLSDVNSVLIIGGDLTSFAFARKILGLGKKVFFSINEYAFWPLRFDKALFKEVFKGMARCSDGTIEVQLGDECVRVGLIGAFFGLTPDIRFLSKSGLRIDRGILVDEFLNTGFEGVYATGDCAQVYHPETRDYWVSIGHDNAVALGRIAARNLAGEKVRARVAKESIFEVHGVKVNSSWWTEF